MAARSDNSSFWYRQRWQHHPERFHLAATTEIFEVVVPLWALDGSMELWYFWHDHSDVKLPWLRGQRVAANIAGAGSIIQSDFVGESHGNFEVIVPVVTPQQTIDLWHFWHDNSDVNLAWYRSRCCWPRCDYSE